MWQFAMILEKSPVGRVVQLQRGCQVAMDSAKQRNAIPLILGRHPHGEVRPGIERDGGRGIVLGSAAWKERRTDTILAVAEFQFRARGAPPGGLDGKSPAIATHPTAPQVAAVGVGVVVDAVPIEKRTALIRSGEPGGWRFHPKIPSRQAGDHGEIDARIEPRTPGRRQRAWLVVGIEIAVERDGSSGQGEAPEEVESALPVAGVDGIAESGAVCEKIANDGGHRESANSGAAEQRPPSEAKIEVLGDVPGKLLRIQ